MDETGDEVSDDRPTMRRPWRKSTFSDPNNCVEAGMLADGTVVMRNSNDHSQGILHLERSAMAALLAGIKAGQFDDLGET
jgi:hypothetical protein